jgi:carboxyl-terminal processing protease
MGVKYFFMIKKNLTNLFLFLSFAIFLFATGYRLGEYQERGKFSRRLNLTPSIDTQTVNQTPKVDFSLFWDVWDELEKKYIDKKKIESKTMLYGAIKGMVASLNDPYTFFLTPDENQKTKDDLQGKFEGIGAQLGLKDNRVIVIAPLKNSPAEKAGLLAGDFINKVDGQPTTNMTLNEAVAKIRGKKGTRVKLTIERDKKQKEIEIIRDQIDVPSIELSFERENIAYLKLNQFGDNTYDEWDKAVNDIVKKKVKGLILDLRDNPGGYLEGAVYIASEFLPQGALIVKQESTTYQSKNYRSTRNGLLKEIPVVVLINKGSASASEILAGALRDHKIATLIGEKSFGKGSVQEALDLKEGAGLHLTVAKWILPNGDWINGRGIEPQIKVENQIKEGNTLNKDNDQQLEKAIEILLK